ncbi:MAG: IS4 family transposase, partial [Legionella sp.]|nr:IS4 family transposase [Legionella sp.]MDR3578470.1 IS4 family transposase [Oryzomonas sp.]MDR3579160.1 IS4 family transposase [Oryzomonas sp.]
VLQILEVNLFEKKPISSLVAEALKRNLDTHDCNQLNLFNY